MRQRLKAALDRVQHTTPVLVLGAFGSSQASNFASALAFAGFMSMFPMILGALSILGLAVRDPATELRAQTLILQLFPGNAQPELQNALHGVRQSAGWLGIASIGGLVWSASSIFGTMEFALTEIFGTKQRDLVRQKLMGFVMMILLVAAIVVTVGVNALAAFLPNTYAYLASFVTGAIVMVALLVVIYRFVPNRTFTLGEVLPGAVLAGVLIELLSLAFPLYGRFAGHFNTYGAQFGLFFLLATWFYLLSELLLLGAVYNRYRMGDPAKPGLIASPMGESTENRRPVEAIKEKQGEAATAKPRAAEPDAAGRAAQPRRPPASAFQRIALPGVIALALAGSVIGRRGRKAPGRPRKGRGKLAG